MSVSLIVEPDVSSPPSGGFPKPNGPKNPIQLIAGANTVTGNDRRSPMGFPSEEEDEDEIPVRSVRRIRPASINLSSNGSPQPFAPMELVTPVKRSRLLQRDTQTASSPFETDSEAPTRKLRQKLSISPRSTRATKHGTKDKDRQSEARRARRHAKTIVISDESEESSSEDIVATPVRRRKSEAHIQPSTRGPDHEEEEGTSEDLQAELEDLQGTGAPLRSTRTRDGPVVSERSKRQQYLEELRRRRAGIKENSQEQDGQDEQEEQDEQDDIDDDDFSGPEPIHHAMRRGGNLDEYENDFVDDDDDDNMGVDLGVAGVPLEFTYHANKKPFDHFKTEIEWMVHNKLNPAFDRYDEMYELAHRKLDKEVEGFAGSKFSSSVWGEEFSKALKARPDMNRVDVPTMLEHKCDACRRSNHPPKHKVTFSGRAYNRDTLETIESEDEEDDTDVSDDNESSSTKDEESFFLGRFDYHDPFRVSVVANEL